MKAYSLDLRQRIVAAYEKGNSSLAEVAEQFYVGQTFVKKIQNQHKRAKRLFFGRVEGASKISDSESAGLSFARLDAWLDISRRVNSVVRCYLLTSQKSFHHVIGVICSNY